MASLQLPATTTTAYAGPKRPADRTVAFAISIVLAKPHELSVREYIRLLRQHVAKGRRENALSSVYRHLDRSSFWRSEYERVKDALRANENETVDLKREVEVLKAKCESVKPAASAPKKRKKVDEDVIPVLRDPKKTKRDSSPTRKPGDLDLEKDFDFADVGEVGNILMRSIFQVHSVLKSRQRTEAAVLAHHLVRAASALSQVVQQTIEQLSKRFLTGPELLKTNLTAAARVLATLIVGINRLSHVSDGADVMGQVIYAYVHMFANFVKMLETASRAEITKLSLPSSTPADNRSATSKGKTKTKAQPSKATGNLKDIPTLNNITLFLCSIIDQLDPKDETHKALFEVFAYTTLSRVGPRLYTCVFGRARGVTLDDEIVAANQLDEIEDAEVPSPATAKEEQEAKQAKLEAPYLIHLLGKVMTVAPLHIGCSTKPSAVKKMTPKSNVKGALTLTAKERLQRTLVNCMFGEEKGGEEAKDCFRMPSLGQAKKIDLPRVKEAEVQEWFKEEVWRLLGWEILGKEDAEW